MTGTILTTVTYVVCNCSCACDGVRRDTRDSEVFDYYYSIRSWHVLERGLVIAEVETHGVGEDGLISDTDARGSFHYPQEACDAQLTSISVPHLSSQFSSPEVTSNELVHEIVEVGTPSFDIPILLQI